MLKLKIVGRAIDQRLPVVLFRVQGAPENNSVLFFQAFKEGQDGLVSASLKPWEFWAPSQMPYPVGAYGDKQFGVIAPTNAGSWRLRLTLLVQHRDGVRKLRDICNLIKLVGSESPRDIFQMVRAEWKMDSFQDQGLRRKRAPPRLRRRGPATGQSLCPCRSTALERSGGG